MADPLPAGTTSIVTTGTVTSDQLEPITTDDPQTVAVGDGTSVPIGGGAGNPEFPGATVTGGSIEDGQVVTEPVDVTATLTPPSRWMRWRICALRIAGGTVLMVPPGDPSTLGGRPSGRNHQTGSLTRLRYRSATSSANAGSSTCASASS